MSGFWAGRAVLITGADGFIGCHLVERLAAEGASVRAFCCYNSAGSLGWIDRSRDEVRAGLDIRLGDIRDDRFVEAACAGIDTVFHLAALIAIPYSYHAPQSYLETNVGGTLNVLEGVRRAGCRRMVHTSTSEVYGTPAFLPITEDHPLQCQSPYAASKVAADKLCEAYHCSYRVPVVVIRPFNTYGPRQSVRAVIPAILTQLWANAPQLKLGRLDPERDFTYVDDTVDGLVRAGEAAGVEGEVIHLGTGSVVAIGEPVRIACRVVGRTIPVVQEERRLRPASSEVLVLQSDPGRARRLLGWAPATDLEDGLARTSDWISRNSASLLSAGGSW